ncbi:type VI secretion system protein ImpM [Paracoccus halophilus]|uniref:Type VI secretion system protein ImpM n=1 Tax=Paracoccus halophilus TaxID=376733 RepID=A0A1I0TJI7_9RHOB|nr:type VI secretion system-associated protein TagF [Paracoccus halophilus]SFA51924.1 type VI secretion system protein ImpM [Paracoccus halophilus]
MSAEHRLDGATGLYGKHPGFGDFISAGLGAGWPGFADWAQTCLGAWRDAAGPDWQARFDAAPPLRFWIGPALTGMQPLRGAWMPSRDRTGRRFPLLITQAGGLPPVVDGAQDFYQAALNGLAGLLAAPGFEPRDELQQLALPAPPEGAAPPWPTFWAVNPELSARDLFAQLAATDHAHATASRSYWWFSGPGGGPSGLLACQGWPGPEELGWLISGGQLERDDE